jgi:hypothetical protein
LLRLVQRRHVPARLRLHLPRLIGQLQPSPRRALHAALRPRRLQPAPHRAHIHPADLGARTHARLFNAPTMSSSSSRATSTGLDTLNPAVTSPPRARLPHLTPFRSRKTDTDHRAAAQPPKDQKCSSQDSGAE